MHTHTFLRITFLILALIAAAAPAQAQRGTPFFLLSDASYGPDETALVRLEAQDLGAVAEYGGADVYVYRVEKPLEFLQSQKNLHRVDVTGDYTGPGLGNALARVWDTWWSESRILWRKLFSEDARKAVVAQAPEVKTHRLAKTATPRQLNPVYRPLKKHRLVESFRYPVALARPIEPPRGVTLAGSSSEFIKPQTGNVMIPIGRRAPGLYLVEAMVGEHRATTLVFVSDSIAVTKVSAGQMLVWVAARRDGKPVAGAQTVWTDGVGVLKSGATDKRGLVTFARETPEKTYVFGEDAQGGVFIGENHYYDSEIYNTKLYAVTDRPLYRPGDQVFVKFMGREFKSARDSVPIAAGALSLQVFDPNGFPVANQALRIASDTGADTSFRLPENAAAGGYELRFLYKGDAYGAAFRVAEYQKPHFEIDVLAEKPDYKTGQEIKGRLQLTYPDGKPVAGATTELLVRAQRLTMIEGDLGYTGQFPVKLSTAMLTTDAKGYAAFVLPPATEPSRYVLTALATDGAAYRVRATKEILIERGAGTYTVNAARAFSAAGESVAFTARMRPGTAAAPAAAWEWVRLEDRRRESGTLGPDNRFAIAFPEGGTYTVSLRDAAGNIVGAASHQVSGAGVRAPQGSIQIVLDKTQYKPGETALALITFPQPVDEALFTLERDRVEKTALMASGERWVRAERVTPTQWRAQLPVAADYGPNITFSVVYVKDGEYVFQNHGLKIEQPRIAVSVKPDKAVYAPGDMVSLDFSASIDGNPAAGAQLTVSVVDEMIYVLQPEIAPDVFDFFYHPRRNNVRTSGSLSFIGYDLAKLPSGQAVPSRRQTHERGIKVIERPRREDKDTALWQPTLTTDAQGRARTTFRMPDSLTRWRVTVRATEAKGTVGQSVAHVRSDKDFYVKWTSPNWLRSEDAPIASVALFNQGAAEAVVELTATGAGLARKDTLKLKPGANFVALPLKPTGTDGQVEIRLSSGGRTVDALAVPLRIVPVQWQSARSLNVPVKGERTAIKLPADAANVRVQFADSAATHFRRVLDDLIDYPYGCVEQTASRILPYSLALQSVAAGSDKFSGQLTQKLHSHRFRLAQLAGPQATFGWWSVPDRDKDDAFMTAYAYYADWHASRALRLTLPPGHWDRLLEVYRTKGTQRSHWHRALMLYWMQEMNLPVGSLANALAEELAQSTSGAAAKPGAHSQLSSAVLGEEEHMVGDAMTRLLTAYVVKQARGTLPSALAASLEPASRSLRAARLPLADALLMLNERMPAEEAARVLGQVRAEAPTIDRALTMLWVRRALIGATDGADPLRAGVVQTALAAPWRAETSTTGQRIFRWPAGNTPMVLQLASAPARATVAVVQFDSREPEQTKLPVHLERRIYRLKKQESPAPAPRSDAAPRRGQAAPEFTSGSSAFTLELLPPDAPLKTDEVYLDEIVLMQSLSGAPLRFGIVEVPLPPGAIADRTTWGISVRYPGRDAAEAMERARYEPAPGGYAVPVETLAGEVVIRHLVRVAQTGTYAMPPARYYRMYEPELKAFEEKPRARIQVR